MEDEPYEEHERSFKNTQHIIVISSALKASITAVIKKTPTLPLKFPSGKSREKKTHNRTEEPAFVSE